MDSVLFIVKLIKLLFFRLFCYRISDSGEIKIFEWRKIVGGGRGRLAADTDGLASWPVSDAERWPRVAPF